MTADDATADHDRSAVDLSESWPAYIVSFVAYVVLGLLFKSAVLNWIIGPLWLLITLHLIPSLWFAAVRLVTRR